MLVAIRFVSFDGILVFEVARGPICLLILVSGSLPIVDITWSQNKNSISAKTTMLPVSSLCAHENLNCICDSEKTNNKNLKSRSLAHNVKDC